MLHHFKSGDLHGKMDNVSPTLAIVGDERPRPRSTPRVSLHADGVFRNDNKHTPRFYDGYSASTESCPSSGRMR